MARIREIVIDALDPPALARFWAEVLEDYALRPYGEAEVEKLAAIGRTPETDPAVCLDGTGPILFFQEVTEPKPVGTRNRLHLDVMGLQREAEVERLCGLGATVRDHHPTFSVLLDPEGNEFCVVDPD